MKIVQIGAGNLATHLAVALQRAGHTVVQVYSRTDASARLLANRLGCAFVTSLEEVITDADWYIFSIKDSALEEVVKQMPDTQGVWVHTAGSMSVDVFSHRKESYGVLYPMQTFSKTREVDFSTVPVFIEASTPLVRTQLEWLVGTLGNRCFYLSSVQRKQLHLAAVFACNFVNHCYAQAWSLLEKVGVPGDVLLGLTDETAQKIHTLSPHDAQTGPAVRYDENVIGKQLALVDDPLQKEIYRLMSESIHQEAEREK